MHLKALTILAVTLFSSHIIADEIDLSAEDGFSISAVYNSPSSPSKKGVLMLHQCNSDKSMYNELGELASLQGFHTLAIDFRGYGQSTDNIYSLKKMKEAATNRDDYTKNVRAMRAEHWPSDVRVAYKFLSKKVGSDNISFIGASCGGGQALILAKKHKPKSFTFFSSGMNDKTTSDFNQISDIPALIVASVGDKYTFKSSNKIFLEAKNTKTRLISYKGNHHGHPLFQQDQNLKNVMVDWFKLNAK